MEDTLILVTGNGISKADGHLELTLVTNYFDLLSQDGSLAAPICFYYR